MMPVSLIPVIGAICTGGEQNLDIDAIDDHDRGCVVQRRLLKGFHLLLGDIGQTLNRLGAEHLAKA
jgi:hypothetical protein